MLENMLDYVRIALYTLLIVLGFLVFQAWNADHPPLVPTTTSTVNTPSSTGERFVPAAPATATTSAAVLTV